MSGHAITLQARRRGGPWMTRNAFRGDNASAAKPEDRAALHARAEAQMREWANIEPGTEFRVHEDAEL